ncbi:MAG: WecB/TagA/CpsF family glycosyltransferase [Verrucomicrobia bacterium]|nr:WecB/TagA/CpsF family glycosyltransferase [Verrucomicrobiota bacterium]
MNIIEPIATALNNKSKWTARANVLGVGVNAINLDLAVAAVTEALMQKAKGYVCVTGVHGVSEAQCDPDFRAILNHSFLTTPDGMPMVWMGRWQGFGQMARVYGPDLMLRLCEAGQAPGWTHFLYGGAPGVAQELQRRLEQRFPGLKIVGAHTPPFRQLAPDEEQALARQVAALKPDIFWVGLSTPKQERFMARYVQELDATLFFGVGAAFDFHAGRMRQAPRWMQRSGLEWLFRLACDPARLWKRYLKNNPLFVLRALSQLAGIKKYRID